MSLDAPKLAVFEKLATCNTPVSLPELLKLLGEQFKERSVRRWLKQLAEEGKVKKTGQRRGTKYSVVQDDEIFTESSLEILRQVQLPLFERKPVAYNTEWFNQYEPNKTYYLTQEKRKELFDVGIRG